MKTKRYFNNKRKHYFALGGGTDLSNIALGSGGAGGTVGMQGAGGIVNTLSGIQKLTSSIGLGSGGIGGMLGGRMGGVANGIATGLNNLMNPNGNETGIGNALSAVGSLASNIPGVGGIIGAGVNLVGGLVNSAFGSNINEEFVKDTENKAQQQAHYDFSASDNSGLLANYANYRNQRNVTKDEVGSEGWFSNAATNKTKELNALINEANRDARASFTNTALNLDEANDRRAASNYFDEGGGIHIKKKNRGKFTSYCGGKVTSECIARGKRSSSPTIRKRAVFAANSRKWKHDSGGWLGTGIDETVATGASFLPVIGTIMDGAELVNNPSWENAGWFLSGLASDIFTGGIGRAALKSAKVARNASKAARTLKNRRLESALERGNRSYSTSMQSYRKHKKLEEEAEREFKKNLIKAGSVQGADALLNTAQQNLKEDGGPLFTQGGIWSNGITQVNEGGTHSENPYEGVQMGVDNQGIPNLVEEGEVVWNDYVFSNRLKPSKEMRKKNKYKGTTFADIAKEIQKESEERPNDWISRNGLETGLSRLAALQEGIRERRNNNKYAKGGKLGNLFAGDGDNPNRLNTYSNYTKLTDDSFYTPEYMNFWNWINNNRSDSRAQRWLNRINSGEFGTVGGNIFNFDDIVRLAHDYKRGPVHNAFALAAKEFTDSTDNPNNRRNNLRFTPDNWELLPEDLRELRDIKLDSPKTDNTTDTVDTSWEYSPLRYAPIVGNGLAVLSDIFSKPDYSAANMIADVPVNPAMTRYNPVGQYLTYRPLDRNYYTNQLRSNAAANRRAIINTSGGNRAAAMAGLLASDYNFGNQLGQLARQAEEYNNAQRERVAAFNRETDLANSRMGLQTNTFNAESRNQATARRLAQAETVARMRQAARDAYDARRSNNLNLLLNDLGNLGREITDRNWLDSLAESGVLRINTKGEFSGNNTKKHGGKLNKKKKGGWRYA